jgi:hypothetical protein
MNSARQANYALKLTSAAVAAPLAASVLRTDWRAARLVHRHLVAVSGGARSLTLLR